MSAAGSGPPAGSSPLARGLPGPHRDRPDRRRIIPARAGFTVSERQVRRLVADHPRSRGVYKIDVWAHSGGKGSSPLARGLRAPPTRRWEGRRIIPARAGFTAWPAARSRTSWDHPRSRGVYWRSRSSERSLCGSSPLARGLRRHIATLRDLGRIIPARAGFTATNGVWAGKLSDHPRSRGVYHAAASSVLGAAGSSPLARGLLQHSDRGVEVVGIIPARAGFTTSAANVSRSSRDHPRSRGVYTCGSLESQR